MSIAQCSGNDVDVDVGNEDHAEEGSSTVAAART